MSNFNELFSRLEDAVSNDGRLSAGLRPALEGAYDAIAARPYDADRVADALVPLLVHLGSEAGRTHPNCVAVDLFFLIRDGWTAGWEEEPSELAAILADIGGQLHDTLQDPEVAENFDSTPEQLLARVRAFRAGRGGR